MKDYVYYDAYHRRKRMPFFFLRDLFRGKKGIFFFFFLLAHVIGILLFSEQTNLLGQWMVQSLQKVDASAMDQKRFLCYLLFRRGGLLLFIVLFGLTKIKKPLFYGVSMAGGFLAGGLCISCIRACGWKGIPLFLVSLLPHWIVYVILFHFLFWLFCEKQQEEHEGERGRYLKKGLSGIFYAGILLVLFGVGIYLECGVNPLLLGWIKKLYLP